MRRLIPSLLLVGALGCGGMNPVESVADQRISGAATPDGVRLVNTTDHAVYYAAFEKVWGTTGLFLWGPCVEPASCPAIAAHSSVVVPFKEISGYHSGATQALVHYYELAPAGGGTHEVKNLHSMVVDF